MRGAATKAMSDIVEERQQSRCPPAAAPLRAAARRLAGGVARSLHTAPGMLVARALPAGLGASSKMFTLFPDGPLVLLVCVSFSGPAFSQIYNCKDKDGNIIISTTSPRRSREPGRDPSSLPQTARIREH